MKILFLDDNLNRHRAFKHRFNDPEIALTAVETAEDCIKALRKETFDMVFLDHDLGGETYTESSRADTGMEVVRWIEEHKPKIGEVIVHSLNPVGASAMSGGLDRSGYAVQKIPFTKLIHGYKGC